MVLSVAVMLALLLDCKGSFAEALAAIVCFLGSKRRERRERERERERKRHRDGVFWGKWNTEMGSFEYIVPAKGLEITFNGQLLSDLNLKFKFKVGNGREERE